MRQLVTAAVLGFALAGCGDSDAPPANQSAAATTATAAESSTKACEILTEADAATALGREVEKLDADGGPAGLDMCQYGYQGERMMDMGQATLTVHPLDLASLRQGVLDQGFKVEPVPGLGDEAFWSEEAGLYVGKGYRSATYMVGVGGAGPADNKRRALDLAKATVGRL